ncbi:MAG: hypothetical protein H0T12_09585 [Actinobacteria bacterium]|nr:hypothetical protein [Actinomycetota bacterium]
MATGVVAALLSVLVLAFVEGLRLFYPAHETWLRLRRIRGRRLVRVTRRRYEAAAEGTVPRRLATLLLGLIIVWVAIASLLDKRWNEVVLDVLPSVIVWLALLRTPGALRVIARRMKEFERLQGEDPDAGPGEDDGPAAVRL